ncbi:MAG TPA: nitrous oxide reductase accessory protein NosL [Vicinamibacterales bacterium]
MTRRALACVALLALAAGIACSARADGPPHLEEDRTACAHCGMLVSERMFAAGYRTAAGEAKVFDDIGCLLAAARAEAGADTQYWFHDAPSRAWIEGRRAVFVHAPGLKTPMAGGLTAYADEAAAREAAAAHGGRVVGSLDRLLEEQKAGKW